MTTTSKYLLVCSHHLLLFCFKPFIQDNLYQQFRNKLGSPLLLGLLQSRTGVFLSVHICHFLSHFLQQFPMFFLKGSQCFFHHCWLWAVSRQLSEDQVPTQSFSFLETLSFSRFSLTDRQLQWLWLFLYIVFSIFFFYKGLSWDNYVTFQDLLPSSFCIAHRLICLPLMQWRILSWKTYMPKFSLNILITFCNWIKTWTVCFIFCVHNCSEELFIFIHVKLFQNMWRILVLHDLDPKIPQDIWIKRLYASLQYIATVK